ncbi:MAG: ABC transporter permease [Nocardioides sp.]|nr:ABC transporter permease [Nocardioides sp.]
MALFNAALTSAVARPLGSGEAAGLLLYRNLLVYRRAWVVFVTGFLEPVFYLLSIGVGVGAMISGFDVGGHHVAYRDFVAPGMVAAAAMNGALLDATFNFFFKLKFNKLYDQVLATPMRTRDVAAGELLWTQSRSAIYATAFVLIMVAMGLVHSWWAVLMVPAALLIGFGFGAVGMALTSWMRSWQDFEYITLAMMPMFLFSATFFPVTAYPSWLRWIVECTPLYRGVVLCRELALGSLTWASLVSVVYLVAFGAVGLLVLKRRLDALLLK